MARTRFLALVCLASSGCIAGFHGEVANGRVSARGQASGGVLDLATALFGAADALATADADAKVVTNGDAGVASSGVVIVEDTSGGVASSPSGTIAVTGSSAASGGGASSTASVASGSGMATGGSASGTAGGPSGSGTANSGSASGTASGSGVATGGSASGATSGASGSGSGIAAASGGASGSAIITGEAPEVDLYAHGTLTGRGHTLGALTGDGVTIRGHVTGLAELTPLADAAYATTVGVGGSEADGVIVHANVVRDASGTSQLVVHLHGAASGTVHGEAHLRFHVVLDRSASMSSQWDRTVAAVGDIVRALPPYAELQVVAYDDHAVTVFGPARVTDASSVIAALDRLEPVGGSNVEAGLRAAYAVALADGGSHVVLVSDGVPDGGAATAADFDALVGGARTRTGCTTSVVAIGANVDAHVLRAVAGAGDGAFVLASSVSQLGAAIARDLRAHAAVAASDVDVHVQLAAGVRFGAAAGDAAGRSDFRLALPRLAPGEDRTIVLPLDGRSSVAAPVQVHVGWKVGVTPRVVSADAALSFHVDAGAAVLALLDEQLGAALSAAGQAIVDGDTGNATIALRAYAHAAAAVPTTDARVAVRTDAVTRIADAVATLGPSASWSDRRTAGNAMLALAWRFGN